MTVAPVLGWVLSRDHRPGMNLKGSLPGATWRFLLPSPYPASCLIVGSSHDAAIALREHDADVRTVEPKAKAVLRAALRYRPSVVVVIKETAISDDAVQEAARAAAASAYVERRRPPTALDALHLAPAFGEIQVAVPASSRRVWNELLAAGEDPTSLRTAHLLDLRRRFSRGVRGPRTGTMSEGSLARGAGRNPKLMVRAARTVVAASAAAERTARRHTRLASRSARVFGGPPTVTSGPPQYIREVSPLEMDAASWWFSATGPYRSQKLVFRIGDLQSPRDRAIVKVGRDRWSSERLEHAADGLTKLASLRAGRHAPRTLFGAWHADSFIAGESYEAGRPFEVVSDGTPHCRWAAASLSALAELATETRDLRADAAPALAALVEAFASGYPAAAAEAGALRRSASVILDDASGRIPSVVQHGDPGTWNIIARDDGTIALLDWENHEARGAPVFDVILFLHGYALFHERLHGVDAHRTIMARHFAGMSPLSEMILTALRDAAASAGIGTAMVPHLVGVALAYQAVKELPRLSPGRLDAGVWLAELRAWITGDGPAWLAGALPS